MGCGGIAALRMPNFLLEQGTSAVRDFAHD